MRVVLVRHSQAAHGHWPDADRPLTAAGEALAVAAAPGLAKLEPAVARVVASPAVRARDTGEILAPAWAGVAVEVDADLSIGGRAEQAVARILAAGTDGAVLVVGHAPDLSGLASLLLGGSVAVRFECCGAACIALDAESGDPGVLEWAMGPEALAAVGAA